MMSGDRQEEVVGRNADDRPFSGNLLFQDNVTKQEVQVLSRVNSKAVREFSVGAAASSLLTWAEQVFDDSASDLPKLRWRHRNFFSDSATSMQRTQDTNDRHGNGDQLYDGDNYQNPRSNANGNLENKSNEGNRDTDSKGAMKIKEDSVDVGIDTMGDPLDSVFGTKSMAEEIRLSGNKSGPNRVTTRSHRKSRRKHRMRQREAVADVPHA